MAPSQLIRKASLGTLPSCVINKDRWCFHHFSFVKVQLLEKNPDFSDFSGRCLQTRDDEILAKNRILVMSMGKKIYSQSKLTKSKRI